MTEQPIEWHLDQNVKQEPGVTGSFREPEVFHPIRSGRWEDARRVHYDPHVSRAANEEIRLHAADDVQLIVPDNMLTPPMPLPPMPLPGLQRGVSTHRSFHQDEPGEYRKNGKNGKKKKERPCPELHELVPAIAELNVDIHPEGDKLPRECSVHDVRIPRCWHPTVYTWKATSLCHKPLYFEDMPLERYGHSHHCLVQPFVSGAHFFATIPVLPYKMGVEHPCECIYPLGYYRPGNCAPQLLYPIPLSLRGAVYQAGVVTGLVFLIP